MSDIRLYKGKRVELLEITYVWAGEQYCTILLENILGRKQRQSVLLRHLTSPQAIGPEVKGTNDEGEALDKIS